MNDTRFRGFWIALLMCAVLVPEQTAQAQQWAQNVRVVTSVKSEQATRVLLDSLVNEVKDRDSVMVRREPGGDRMTMKALQNDLIENGLGVYSANRLFVEYGFQIQDNRFVETIQGLQYVFRPQGSGEEDVKMLYLSGDNPVTQEVLSSQGMSNPENLQAVTLFKEEVSFAALSLDQGADIVAVGGTPIRGEFDQRRKAVLRRFKQFIYTRDKVYMTQVK